MKVNRLLKQVNLLQMVLKICLFSLLLCFNAGILRFLRYIFISLGNIFEIQSSKEVLAHVVFLEYGYCCK